MSAPTPSMLPGPDIDKIYNGKPIIRVSNSSMNLIHHCPRKYQINKRFTHGESQWDDSLASMGGRAVHAYIQSQYRGEDEQESIMEFFRTWDFNVEDADSTKNRLERNMEAAFYTAKYACSAFGVLPDSLASIKLPDGTSRPGTEIKFAIYLTSPNWKYTYKYVGAIDLLLYSHHTSTYTVIDIKTHRKYATDLEFEYKWDTQTIPYGLVIAQIANSSLTSFQANYQSIFVDVCEPRCETIPFTRTEADIAYWLDNITRECGNIDKYADRDVWPRTGQGCSNYGRPCKYFATECDVTSPDQLQDLLLFNKTPKVPKPYGEWVSLEIEV